MKMTFSGDELRLLLFWRERCNTLTGAGSEYECLLYCLKGGPDFCHKLTQKLKSMMQEMDQQRKKQK